MAGNPDVFVVKSAPTGDHLFSKRFGGIDSDWARAVDFDVAGRIYVGGHFRATMPLGIGPLVSAGGDDAFLFMLDPNGNPLWAKSFGGSGEDRIHSLAARPDGGVVFAGYIQGTVQIGGPPLSTPPGTRGMFVAAYDPNGNYLWSKLLGPAGTTNFDYPALGVDAAGNVLIAGACSGALDFGAGPVPCGAGNNLFFAKLGMNGQPIWSKVVPSTAAYGYGIQADPQGNVIVTGHFQNSVDLGLGPLTSSGGYDVFVAKYAP